MNNLLKIIYNFINFRHLTSGCGVFFFLRKIFFFGRALGLGLGPALFKAPIFLSNNFCQKLRITFKAQMEVREIKYWIILQILSFKTNAHKQQRPLLYFKFSTNQFLLIFIPPHIHFFHYILFFFEKWHQQLELGRS